MMVRLALFLIVAATLAASFVAITDYARAAGAHTVLVYALPAALEPLALAAAWQHLIADGKDRGSTLLVFWLAFLIAVAINVADAYPNGPLMALHAIPPAAVIAGGHLFLEDYARRRRTRQTLEQRLEPQVRDELRAVLAPEVRAEIEPKVRAQLERTTRRTITETTETTERAQLEATGLEALKADVRPIVEAHLAAGGDALDSALTERVMRELPCAKRTAQQRLAPIRAEVRA